MLKVFKQFLIIILMISFGSSTSSNYEKLVYEFNFNDLNGNKINFSEYKNKVIIVINVASQCGFTSQYVDMQNIWDTYREKGLILIGVPSNDFGNQEPGTSSEIRNFCEAKFGITFPLTKKAAVKGDNAHPFYKWAKENHGNSAVPKWNFHKIIIDKNGKVFDTFASITNPSSKRFISSLEKALN